MKPIIALQYALMRHGLSLPKFFLLNLLSPMEKAVNLHCKPEQCVCLNTPGNLSQVSSVLPKAKAIVNSHPEVLSN